MAIPARAHLSIGEVLSKLRIEFPDITISKIRFLESEGLLEPSRTPSGYRKFTPDDAARLRYILTLQRDQYLPLRVIKEHLDALDRGLEPENNLGNNKTGVPRLTAVEKEVTPSIFTIDSNLKLSKEELLDSSGLSAEDLSECEAYGLIAPRGRYYDGFALSVARTVKDIAQYGIEPRHLRSFKSAADREIGLVEQVIAPLSKQKGSEVQARVEEVIREFSSLSVKLHAALVASGLHRRP